METSSLYLSISLAVISALARLNLLLKISAINTESACPVPPADRIGPANDTFKQLVPFSFCIMVAETIPSRGATKIPSVKTAKPAQTP